MTILKSSDYPAWLTPYAEVLTAKHACYSVVEANKKLMPGSVGMKAWVPYIKQLLEADRARTETEDT